MIKREFYTERSDSVKLYRSYSDQNKIIRQDQTGNEYSEAIDVENAPYTYTETDKEVPSMPDDERIEKLEERQNNTEKDVEANAEAIEELASIIAGEE